MRSLATAATAAALAVLAAAPAAAHHGWSGYDSSNLVTLEGTVQGVSYDNPHVTVALRGADGTRRLVLAPPSRMGLRGLPEGAIKVDQAVSIQGYQHRQEPDEFRAERITVDGKTVELR